jgi:hypothetical protein
VKDFARVVANNKKSESMAHVFREASKVAKSFRCGMNRLCLCGRVIMGVVNRLVETIIRDHANVRDLAVDHTERGLAIERWGGESIEDVSDILETKVPHVRRGIGGVHGAVDGAFDILPAAFSMILVLVVWLALPISDDKGTQDVMGSFTDFIRTTITDEFIHSTTFADDILEGVDEFLRAVHGEDVNDVGVTTDEDLGTSVTVDSGNLGYNCVRSNRFVTTENIEHGER